MDRDCVNPATHIDHLVSPCHYTALSLLHLSPLPIVMLCPVDGRQHVGLGAVGGGGGGFAHLLQRVRDRRHAVLGGWAREHTVQHVVEAVHLKG